MFWYIKKLGYLLCVVAVLFAMPAFAAENKVKEYTTQKGIKVWAVEDNYLPIVSLKIAFTKSGTAHDPEDKQGLANMVSDLMVEGAGGISGIDYMKKVEGMASSFSFSVDEDNYYVEMTCLKENLEESMRLLVLAVTSPDFTPDAIERIRKTTLVNIARQEESAEGKAHKMFRETYFAGHPYARPGIGTEAGVNAIKREDLAAFAKNRFARSNMVVGVAGNISAKEINKIVDKYLAPLPAEPSATIEIPEFTQKNKGKIIRIEKDVPQTAIIFGFPGPKRTDADFYPTYITNYIMGGGGFESRLMNEVREKKGLAYTIYTSVQTQANAGFISGYVGTKNASVEDSLKLIQQEIKKIHDSGISKEELADAKDYLIGSFPLKLTQNRALADFTAAMQYQNLGVDFLDKRNDYINGVDVEKANAAAKYFDLDKMLVVIVGKSK